MRRPACGEGPGPGGRVGLSRTSGMARAWDGEAGASEGAGSRARREEGREPLAGTGLGTVEPGQVGDGVERVRREPQPQCGPGSARAGISEAWDVGNARGTAKNPGHSTRLQMARRSPRAAKAPRYGANAGYTARLDTARRSPDAAERPPHGEGPRGGHHPGAFSFRRGAQASVGETSAGPAERTQQVRPRQARRTGRGPFGQARRTGRRAFRPRPAEPVPRPRSASAGPRPSAGPP